MFSGFYDALNQGVSSVLPDGSSPTPTNYSPSVISPRSPRGSFTRDAPSSPSSASRYVVNGSSAANAGDGTQSPTYSTYQRRTKPSLEERLRASLAAKERGRMISEQEKTRAQSPPASVPKGPEINGEIAQENGRDTELEKARNVVLPASPPMEASTQYQALGLFGTQPPAEIPEASIIAQPAPVSSEIKEEPEPVPVQVPTLAPEPAPAVSAPVSTPLPPIPVTEPVPPLQIPTLYEEAEELPAPTPTQTITLTTPPPPPSKYDDPLTPALFELERERDAAFTKARLARSPARASAVASIPGLSPSPTKQQFGHGRSRSMVPEGEPFIRFGGSSSSPGMGMSSFSLEQVLRRPGVLEGLGLEGVHDEEGLKTWAEGIKAKLQTSQEENTRLQAKLLQYDGRMEELRDTHRLESLSQSELVESLRQKNSDANAQIAALESSLATERSLLAAERSTRESLIAAERARHNTGLADLEGLKEKLRERDAENARLAASAKEEEEKRTKAISLLKTVRTKLVKAEKDRDDAVKEATTLRENAGAGERNREEEFRGIRSELDRVRNELDRTRAESSREVERVREESLREFERRRGALENEVASLRDSMERDILARRGEWEIEGIAAKTAHQKEVANLNSRIAALSSSLNQLTDEKATLFSDLQFRTSDLESSRTRLEDLQSQLTEANFQLREREEQLTMAQVELSEARRAAAASPSTGSRTSIGGTGGADVARLLAAAESRSEARVLELRSRLRTIEAERAEQEESWSRSLAARTEEIERLRRFLSTQESEGKRVGEYKALTDSQIEKLEERIKAVQGEKAVVDRRVRTLEKEVEGLREGLEGRNEEVGQLKERIEGLTSNLDELKGKEAQLKLGNKTLREELRKVQSSAALLERQRNPGVGYWSAGNPRTPLHGTTFSDTMAAASTPDLSRSAASSSQARPGTPVTPVSALSNGRGRAPSTAGSTRSSMEAGGGGSVQGEEEVNLEYLRNVILQFLEHEKMRPNLVRVLSVILRFTPQETRRLIAKV